MAGILSWSPLYKQSLCNSSEDCIPIDEIYQCPILACVAVSETKIRHQESSASNSHQGDMPYPAKSTQTRPPWVFLAIILEALGLGSFGREFSVAQLWHLPAMDCPGLTMELSGLPRAHYRMEDILYLTMSITQRDRNRKELEKCCTFIITMNYIVSFCFLYPKQSMVHWWRVNQWTSECLTKHLVECWAKECGICTQILHCNLCTKPSKFLWSLYAVPQARKIFHIFLILLGIEQLLQACYP